MENESSIVPPRHRGAVRILVAACVILDLVVWGRLLALAADRGALRISFLDVGQGDAALVTLPGGARMLIDGGPPNGKILQALDTVLPPTDRTIDLVVLSHAQLDHFGGLIDVAKRYRIGAFLWNGVSGTAPAYRDLAQALSERGIKTVTVLAGDRIRYGSSRADILSPSRKLLVSDELNDTSIVLRLESAGLAALFTGDISEDVERALVSAGIGPVEVLKVPHHGSRFSSTASFLDAVQPALAVIGVGKNSYGHPTPQTLERLARVGARIFRTDRDGTVEVLSDGTRVTVFAE